MTQRPAPSITRRRALQLGAAALLPLAAGCGGGGGGSRSASSAPTHGSISDEPDGKLRVFEWQGYDHPSFKALKPYVTKYGKPTYTYITSPSEMVTKVRSGYDVDVMHPGIQDLPAMRAFDMIQPWDMSLIPHADDLDESFLELGRIDGKQYLMPFDAGPDSVMYRADRVEPPDPESYSMLFDKRYKGRISWYDAASDNLVLWGLMNEVDDPLKMSDAELAEAKKFFVAHKPLVRNLWSLQTALEADMAAGNVWIAHAFGASYPPLRRKKVDVVFGWPKEGRLIYSVGYVLAKDTAQYAHAHAFVSTMTSPAGGLELTNTFGYQSPNTEVDLTKVDDDTVKAFGLGDPSSVKPPKAFVVRGQTGDRLRAYEKTWSEVKAA